MDRLAKIPLALVESAKADSWWQMLILHGATAKGWKGTLLSYEAPTYFGMLTAAYLPVNAPLPKREREVSPGSASPPRKRTVRRTRGR